MAGLLRLEFRKSKEVPDWRTLTQLWSKAPQEFEAAMRGPVQQVLTEWRNRAKDNMPFAGFRNPTARDSVKIVGGSGSFGSRGRLEGSVRVQGEEVVSGVAHFRFISGGRTPGRPPPYKIIAASYEAKFGVKPGNPVALARKINEKAIAPKDPLGDARNSYDGAATLAAGVARFRSRMRM